MINKIDIKNRILQITAAKSRFMDRKALNTFDAENDNASKLASGLSGSITSSDTEILLSYAISDLKNSLSTILKRKGRFGEYEQIIFNEHNVTQVAITSINKAAIFTECTLITANANKEGGVLTVDDEALFNSLYEAAIRELNTALQMHGNIANDTLTMTELYSANTMNAISGKVRSYILNRVLNLFFKIKNTDMFGDDAAENITTLTKILHYHTDSAESLKELLYYGALLIQEGLHALNRRLPSASLQITLTDIIFKIKREDIEISGENIHLIYNIGRSILLNAALKKWFELSSIDSIAEQTEVDRCLATLKFLTEDRLRLSGLFESLYSAALDNIMFVYQEYAENATATTADDITTISLPRLNPGNTTPRELSFWAKTYNHCNNLIYEYILNHWYMLSGNEASFDKFESHLKELSYEYIKLKSQL